MKNLTPTVFSLGKNGNLLTVYQADGPRLLRGEIQWRYTPDEDKPWSFTIKRSVNQSQLVMTPDGIEGDVDAMINTIVDTFLSQAGKSEK